MSRWPEILGKLTLVPWGYLLFPWEMNTPVEVGETPARLNCHPASLPTVESEAAEGTVEVYSPRSEIPMVPELNP